ncbi:choline/carnitine O-acyltransferase [Stenoxybacter acetivorans]|uniref:choline/carnitine O-acyltransferase n=1 Tax=Stenoxybacter acetivorans TaxID=422441 RepID=UPI00056C9EC7|nr:choline/carnitine O-acyltransferase [Stenoxybacter acetivorans]
MQKLSPLPLPPLDDTFPRFLHWAQPFLNEQQQAETAATIQRLKPDAEQWQAQLAEKQKNQPTGWLYDDWIHSYLSTREPLTLSANFAVEIFPEVQKDVSFLEHFIHALVHIASLWQQKKYPPESDLRGSAIDMNPFAVLGGYCRIPKPREDMLYFARNSKHIAVYHHDQLYRLEVLDNDFQAAQLPDIIGMLTAKAHQNNDIRLSAAGFMPIDDAAAWRTMLKESHADYFETIESSLFTITLIDEAANTENEALRQALFLNGSHGWPFKSMHFVFNTFNNRLWANFEHSYQDAGLLTALLQKVQIFMANNANVIGGNIIRALPQRISENLSTKQQKQLAVYQQNYLQKTQNTVIQSLKYAVNPQVIKTVGADALCQLIHVYAILKVMGEPRSIYEAVAVPHFAYGRTECVRAFSAQMQALAAAMLGGCTASKEILSALLAAAVQEHKNRIKQCKKGLGVDRHLLGLKLAAEQDKSVSTAAQVFFNGQAYQKESENFFSTSSLGAVGLTGVLIYNPVESEGFGVAYGYRENAVIWHLSYAKHLSAQAQAIAEAFQEGLACAERLVGICGEYLLNEKNQ